MEPSPKIIELYGLPGCGKTTLCYKLEDYFSETTTDVDAVWNIFWSQGITRRLLGMPFCQLAKLSWLFIISPKLPKKEWNIYIGFIKHIVVYHYVKKTKYRYLLSDNGLVQDMVSLFYRKERKLSKKHVTVFYKIIKEFDNLNQVYCNIPVRLSLERIRTRNRNKGRLDLISDDNNLAEALAIQLFFFKKMNNILQSKNVKYHEFDMNDKVDIIARKFIDTFYSCF